MFLEGLPVFLEHPLYDFLDFTYSEYGEFQITSNSISVIIYDFWILKGFPDYSEDKRYLEAIISFNDVVSSTRTIHKYTSPQRQELEAPMTIHDAPFEAFTGVTYPCLLLGFFRTINAWVDWEIMAANITIKDT